MLLDVDPVGPAFLRLMDDDAPTLTHRYADLRGIRLHYVTAGTGPLIVFLHGFPEFWYQWTAFLLDLGRDHQAVAPDLRGYNLSSRPAAVDQYRLPHLVEDVRLLAEHLGPERFVLVGHDWGGVVAWAFALYHPERLVKLVTINAPHPRIFARELRENPAQQAASQYMRFLAHHEAEQFLSANDHAALREALATGSPAALTEADRQAYVAAWSQPGALTGALNYYRAAGLGTAPVEEWSAFSVDLPETVIRVPTLVIWGEQDRALLTSNLDGLDQLVPAVVIRRIAGASHWVTREQPATVIRYIRQFLAGDR
jgi:pimeloyl-ACP methyl ester carboxylesterase